MTNTVCEDSCSAFYNYKSESFLKYPSAGIRYNRFVVGLNGMGSCYSSSLVPP